MLIVTSGLNVLPYSIEKGIVYAFSLKVDLIKIIFPSFFDSPAPSPRALSYFLMGLCFNFNFITFFISYVLFVLNHFIVTIKKRKKRKKSKTNYIQCTGSTDSGAAPPLPFPCGGSGGRVLSPPPYFSILSKICILLWIYVYMSFFNFLR